MKVFIETERLVIRQYKESDLADFIRMNQDEHVMEFFLRKMTVEESTAAYHRMQDKIEEQGYAFFAVEEKSSGSFIGFVGLLDITFDVDFAPGVEIGWRMLPEFWGKGYATEAAKACLRFAKETLGLSKVYSFTTTQNIRSSNVMQKIGMRYVKNFNHPLVPDDHPLLVHVLYEINM
ncbi:MULTISPECIES: GNAT family N-acetyltransferase [Myroides]|uniref:GNAT family N-acetyltransferase n=1 Tax=Myroides albus TaxID=2562892 RepID=A0A6I3LNC2_9FLAO|nr:MULTISPECIES: GNAT family N-acetyltransferase [Myroides]MTG98986.1 GNAT family N-acetyltransferase [Myroides albus]MVX35780.1 GNAT family N-acetyltransferase [Myroides sp. LoEW2-1]UVD78262.1 GNAT family N-acetyltransferase [Myroides albus]